MSTTKRFFAKVEREGCCWLWKATKLRGYGLFWDGSGMARAHRWLWERRQHQRIPEGYDLHHLCENRACVRPEHLQLLLHGRHTSLHQPPKTHCSHGHPYEGDNLYVHNGRRLCRACRRRSRRELRERARNSA